MSARPLVLMVAALMLVSAQSDACSHRSAIVKRAFQKAHPCPATGLKTGACPGFVRDHVTPLCAGGKDIVTNLQWQTLKDALAKDVVEQATCRKLRLARRVPA